MNRFIILIIGVIFLGLFIASISTRVSVDVERQKAEAGDGLPIFVEKFEDGDVTCYKYSGYAISCVK